MESAQANLSLPALGWLRVRPGMSIMSLMPNIKNRMLQLACAMALMASIASAESYEVGQKVQVREGDTWSSASVVAHEGRKYQVHYDGSDSSTDEWVTTDRIRSAAGNATPLINAPAASQPSSADKSAFDPGNDIEAKWGGLWRKATVIKKSGDWTMVKYDNVWFEWVQPWRVRAVGSTQDTKLDSSPRGFVKQNEPAPTQSPEEVSNASNNRMTHRHRLNQPAGASDADSDPDAFHISEKVGPDGLAISKVQLSGHEFGSSAITGSPTPDSTPVFVAPKKIELHRGGLPFGSKPDLLVNPRSNYALISIRLMGGRDVVGTVQKIDLSASSASEVVTLEPGIVPVALSIDGKRLIAHSDKFFPATKWRLDLWTLDGGTPKALLSFRPYPAEANGTDQILWGSYLDENHLLTCSTGHALSLWEITDTSVKNVYTLQGDNTLEPRLSGGGKYVTVGYGAQAMVCEALTGKTVAKCMTLSDTDGMAGSLNRDLTKLALSGSSRLVICDLQSDKVLLDVGLPIGVTGSEIDWMSPSLLLIDGRWIFDIEHHSMVWQYTTQDHAPYTRWVNDKLWVILDGDSSSLTSADLLDSAVMDADKQLTDGVFQIEPGTKVSLQVNVECSAEEKQQMLDGLTRRVQKAGLIVADDQPIQLVADSRQTNERQVTYRSRGISRSSETVSVANTVQSLTFVMSSKPIWSNTLTIYANAPVVVFHKANESIAQTLAEQKKSKLDWFTSTGIPQTVLKPADPVGTSPLTASLQADPK